MIPVRSFKVLTLESADEPSILALHSDLMRCPTSGEAAAVATLRLMIHGGIRFTRLWGIPRIDRYRLEVNVSGGRVDVVLFHHDQSVSLVEVKGATVSRRDVLAGIGQLCYYATQAPITLRLTHGAPLRRILCAPFDPEEMMELSPACDMAGVLLRNLPPYLTLRAELAAYRADIQRVAVEQP